MCLFFGTIAYNQSEEYHLKLAYQGGMLVNPGMSLGLSYGFAHWSNTKRNGNTVGQEIRLGISASFYHHRRLNTGLMLGPELEWLRTGSKGSQFGFSVSSGFLRTFIANVYTVDDNGQVQPDKLSGTNHFFVSPGIRLGKHLSISKGKALEWYIKPQLQFQMPYFEKTNKYFLTEVGVNFKL